jgi:hypothetical protein
VSKAVVVTGMCDVSKTPIYIVVTVSFFSSPDQRGQPKVKK